jgi:GT2 family glycosyltransferase
MNPNNLINNLCSNRETFGTLSVEQEFIFDIQNGSDVATKINEYFTSLDIRDLQTLANYALETGNLELANTINNYYENLKFHPTTNISRFKVAICYITVHKGSSKFARRNLFLEESIKSLEKLHHKNYEIHVLVNNALSSNETTSPLANSKYYYYKQNKGLAFGRNKLIEEVLNGDAEYLMFLDDDTYVNDPYLLTKLIEVAQKEQGIAMIGPQIIYKKKKVLDTGLPFVINSVQNKKDYTRYLEVDFVEGSCTMFPCSLLREVSNTSKELYPTRYNYYWEETLFAWKLWYVYGKRNIVVKGATIVHVRDGGGFKHIHSYYYFVRNFLYFIADMSILQPSLNRSTLYQEAKQYTQRLYSIAKELNSLKHKVTFWGAILMGLFYMIKLQVGFKVGRTPKI